MPPIDVMHFKDAEGRHCSVGHITPYTIPATRDQENVVLTVGMADGELPDAVVRIPNAAFEQIVAWYQQPKAPAEE